MPTRQWQLLYDEIVVKEVGKPLPKPTEAELDDFEVQSGFKLPMAYREFIQVFGVGTIGQSFQIFVPWDDENVGLKPNNDKFVELFQRADSVLFNSRRYLSLTEDDQSRLHRLVYFAGVSGGDVIGWDPDEVTDIQSYEYGIYLFPFEVKPQLLAESFSEFVDEVCFGDRVFPRTDEDEAEFGSRREFRPAMSEEDGEEADEYDEDEGGEDDEWEWEWEYGEE